MQKGGFKGIFKNAITKLKECHLTSNRSIAKDIMTLEDEIDFDNQTLGESKIPIIHTKMRSAIIQNEKKITPYQLKSNLDNNESNLKIIKNNFKFITKIIGEKKIILKRSVSSISKKIIPNNHNIINKSDDFTWKHDLCSDMINKNYKVFIRNLSNSVVKSELYEIFSQYGVISGINVLNIFK